MNPIIELKSEYRYRFFKDKYIDQHKEECAKISVIVVSHLVDTSIPFLNMLNDTFDLLAIIPKPKSINKDIINFIPNKKLFYISREEVTIDFINNIVTNSNNKFVILDIGGYFSDISNEIKFKYKERFLGVIEDTENGYKKYSLQENKLYSVISVARSILKENEDYLVGQAVVFSTESILRNNGIIINNKTVGLIGIGKIGNGILSTLKFKTTQTLIYDNDPTRLVFAYSKGNYIVNKFDILKESEIIFCSTGSLSLQGDDFRYLKNGCFIASVTSSDDEMDLNWLKKSYVKTKIDEYVDEYSLNGHYFYLINEGNAVNFIHGAVVDDFILLVQKEIIDSIIDLNNNQYNGEISHGNSITKKRIADSWLKNIIKLNI